MRTVIVTGSAGLIGSEAVKRFAKEGTHVVGIDNDMRAQFFGAEASTKKTRDDLIANVRSYEHHDLDIRDASALFLHRQTKSMATRRIGCRCVNYRNAGKSSPGMSMSRGSPKP